MNVDLSTLDIFRSVAEELSVTRAAQRLGRAQSNVTTRIQQLEAELGTALFVREGKRITLSDDGERFLGYADKLLALAEEARQALRPDAPAGLLRLGAMESTAASRLPAPLARFHAAWPAVRLEVSTGPSLPLIERVRARGLDAALVALPEADGEAFALAAHGLDGEAVFREELVLVLPPGHRAVRGPDDLRVHALAAFAAGCTYRAIAEDWLGAAMREVQVVGSYHAMLACVAAGSCVSVVPRSVLRLAPEAAALRTRSLSRVDTVLVWRAGYATAAFDALRDGLRG